MDDIEDIINEEELQRSAVELSRTPMVPPKAAAKVEVEEDASEVGKSVPGTEAIWLKTFGCSHNVSDSEYMQGVLASYGYRFTTNPSDAQLWLLNSCTVKDPSEAAFMHLVTKAKNQGKGIVVAGCVPQADRQIKGLEGVSIVGIQQVDRVVEVVEETLKGHTVRLLSRSGLPKLDLPKIRKNPSVEIIPLSTGCLGACTYCRTRHARGKLGSYAPEAIVQRAQSVIDEGVTEIWLSSEDTGAYGLDIGTTLPELLWKIIDVLPDGVMLRVGMTNPPYILDHLDAIAQVLNHPSVYAFLHVPVQSGSNEVLTNMYREYTVEEFSQVADYLLAHVPKMTLATDIICGFPGETEEQFEETMQLVEKYRFHIMNISQFYPRPGTPAAKMKRVPTQVVKNRSRRLTKLFETFDPYPYFVSTTQKVWVNTETSDDGKYTVGHTKNFTKVLMQRDDSLIGCSAQVKITSASRFHISGEVVSRSEPPTRAACVVRDEIRTHGRDSQKNKVPVKVESKSTDELSNDCCGDDCCGSCDSQPAQEDVKKPSTASSWIQKASIKCQEVWNDKVALAAFATVVASTTLVTIRMFQLSRSSS